MENFGLAIEDANQAIKIDPDYIKAYYRRASASLVLCHYDDAIEDLKLINARFPNDKGLLDKLNLAKKEGKLKKFRESITSDRSEDIKKKSSILNTLESTKIENNYDGPVYPEDGIIDADWVKKVMEDMTKNKFIHKKYLVTIISKVKDYYEDKNTMIDVSIPDDDHFNVCGDIHGQFYDLMNIFNINDYPSKSNPYLFNGDFVDRGSFSVEVIITLLCWKVLYPEHFHLTRGNHESRNLNKLYGFEGEVKSKYDESVYECFCELFCTLPLAHCLNKKVLVVHGGLFSQDGVTLDNIRNINRKCEPPEKGLMCELLWSDPGLLPGRHPSKRGVGTSFGPDITKKFLELNDLELLVRSHEVKDAGYEIMHDGKTITVFSAPNYCDQMGNKGALIKFNGKTMKPKFVQYTAVDHPKVPPMKYANPWMLF